VSIAPVFEAGFSDDSLAIAEQDRVVIMVWRGSPSADRIERATDGFAAITSRMRENVSLIAVIEERSPPPRIEDLSLVVRGFDAYRERMLATVGVFEDRVATSTILDAASVIRALQRRPLPTKFCADRREAATWLASRHPHEGDLGAFSSRLVEAIEATRARL
jgi:hypothetical protein